MRQITKDIQLTIDGNRIGFRLPLRSNVTYALLAATVAEQ